MAPQPGQLILLVNRVAALEASNAQIKTQVDQMNKRLQSVEGSVQQLNALKGQIPGINNRVNSLQTRVNDLSGSLSSLTNKVNGLVTKIDANTSRSTKNAKTLSDLVGRTPTVAEKNWLTDWSNNSLTRVRDIADRPYILKQIDAAALRGQGALLKDSQTTAWLKQRGQLGDWVTSKIDGIVTNSRIRGAIDKTFIGQLGFRPWDTIKQQIQKADDALAKVDDFKTKIRGFFSDWMEGRYNNVWTASFIEKQLGPDSYSINENGVFRATFAALRQSIAAAAHGQKGTANDIRDTIKSWFPKLFGAVDKLRDGLIGSDGMGGSFQAIKDNSLDLKRLDTL